MNAGLNTRIALGGLAALLGWMILVPGSYHPARLRASATPVAHSQPVRDSWILISTHDRTLAVMRGREVASMYPIAIGASSTPTPLGEFHIRTLDSRPGPLDGMLGARWMEFYRKTTPDGVMHLYGIHGTNVPEQIGGAVSHGCIRLSNRDVEDVFRNSYIGEPVQIVDTPLHAGT